MKKHFLVVNIEDGSDYFIVTDLNEIIREMYEPDLDNGEDFETTWLDYVIDSQRAGQDVRYSINDNKLKSLGWSATAEFDTELSKVVQYYKDNFIW